MAQCSPTRECPAVTVKTMNKPTDIFSSVRSQAFDWYAALKSPDRIQELWPSFEEWLKNPQHEAMYLWVERICRAARDLAESCEALNLYARRHSRRSWPLNGLEATGRLTAGISRAGPSAILRGRIYGHLASRTRFRQQRKRP